MAILPPPRIAWPTIAVTGQIDCPTTSAPTRRSLSRFVSRRFIVSDELEVSACGNGHLVIEGTLKCAGEIVVDVRKILKLGDSSVEADLTVQTIEYRYNARVQGRANIVRYDSPHVHRPMHHVHRYNTFATDTNEQVSESNWPTLREALMELEDWYYANFDKLNAGA